jgi:hypothetical protein
MRQSKITLSWLNADENVLVTTCEYGWNWKEMAANVQESNVRIASKSHTVDAIYNLNKTNVPLNASLFFQMSTLTTNVPANAGKVYIVNGSSFGIKMVKIFSQTTRSWANKLMVCDSIQQALDDLQKRRVVSH